MLFVTDYHSASCKSHLARRLSCIFVASAVPFGAPGAQDSIVRRLPSVEVHATREPARSALDLPLAVTVVRPDSARPGLRRQSFDELLFAIPGLTASSRTNPAQDPRLFIRGFGSRSAFGVRGVRVLRDGIPLTLPDGQTPVDWLDLESVGRIEVIRGSAASLYGNAAGGVVDVRSADPPAGSIVGRARLIPEGYGSRRLAGSVGGTIGGLGYQATLVRASGEGYRRWSDQRSTHAFARATMKAGATSVALQATLYDAPLAQDPGALTASQFEANPRMADPFWVARRVRKTVRQGQVGVSLLREGAGRELAASIFSGWRALDNTRPTFVIDLDRRSDGASVRAVTPLRVLGRLHRITAGIDAQRQSDERRNDANCNGASSPSASCPTVGVERGVAVLAQRERVTSVGPFLRDEITLGARLRLVAGVRGDWVRFEVRDRLVSDANLDDSGVRTLRRVSPALGAVVRFGVAQAAYANVSSAFETPTASELTTRPDGSGGMNPDLRAQRATTTELGVKGHIGRALRYDVATFDTRVRDELIQFDVPDVPGRSYYRNAGRTTRRGAELAVAAVRGALEIHGAYTLSRFRFARYDVEGISFAGKRIPGIPAHQFQLGATWRHGTLYLSADGLGSSRIAADDANSHHVPGYIVTHVRAGGTVTLGQTSLTPMLGISNVFDRRFAGSVVVNAAGAKFYEPAPGRTVYAGAAVVVGR